MTNTPDERCEITELVRGQCAHCRRSAGVFVVCVDDPFSAPAPRRYVPVAAHSPWFTASYDGSCASCGESICPGDSIRSDTEGGYLGTCCGT